jgi:hypothetical protein
VRTPQQIYGPRIDSLALANDLELLFQRVDNWRTTSSNADDISHYKAVAQQLHFVVEHGFPEIAKKGVDLFKCYPDGNRVVIEIETSTIENGYNDLLKILELLQVDQIDIGIIVFIDRVNDSGKNSFKARKVQSSIINAFPNVLKLFHDKLILFYLPLEAVAA